MVDNFYEETAVNAKEYQEKPTWKPFLRQLLVISGTWVIYFLFGLSFGMPTVLIPQLRREANSTDAVSEEMASWLSSASGYGAIPWVIILCICTRKFGRKIPFAIVCLNTILYYLVLYCSTSTTHILISGIMQGMNQASNMTISIIIVTEYSSPKYRGMFLAIKSATIFWGIWVANAIGTFFYWKNIALFGFLLSFYPVTIMFWPESPQWLADKGCFDECRSAHRWLRGSDKKSEEELECLIKSQQDYFASSKKKTSNYITSFGNTLSCKAFYKPVSLSVVMMMQYQLTGKIVCVIYAIDIIKKITDSESAAYIGMLVLDGVTVAGMYAGCFLSKFLKRRTLLFTTSALGIAFLYILSLYLYLIKLKVIEENAVVTVTLLMLFSVTISCGPLIMSTSIYGEITPLRYKSSCMMIAALTFVTLTSTLIKLFPYILKIFNMHGAFFFYAIASTVCSVILYIYLPETKDKTLQEIQTFFDKSSIPLDEGKELLIFNRKCEQFT